MRTGVDAASGRDDFTAGLPRKRMAAGVLMTDDADRVLIVEPVYKDDWEIPGGTVEADESPYAAAGREIAEELGLSRPVGGLLVVDWVSPRPGRTEGLMLVFDGGRLTAEEIAGLALPADELRGYVLCAVAEAAVLLSPVLARRLTAAVAARASGTVAYLEDGHPVA
ncbi:MAG TPA: NUDIX hydrolase [Micromonosporaceae bacterium]|nr:NUDIX hydrolase [Micromonosporaceae bacterium]